MKKNRNISRKKITFPKKEKVIPKKKQKTIYMEQHLDGLSLESINWFNTTLLYRLEFTLCSMMSAFHYWEKI